MTIQHTRASVIAENLRDFLDISTGAHQGDPVSTTLFNLVWT